MASEGCLLRHFVSETEHILVDVLIVEKGSSPQITKIIYNKNRIVFQVCLGIGKYK